MTELCRGERRPVSEGHLGSSIVVRARRWDDAYGSATDRTLLLIATGEAADDVDQRPLLVRTLIGSATEILVIASRRALRQEVPPLGLIG